MTFQEAIDEGRKIVFHGHEPGYWLISFDDEQEVRRIPNKEFKAATDRFRTPEQQERDMCDEETTLMVNAEMSGRLARCNAARWLCIVAGAVFALMIFYSAYVGKPSGLWFFIPAWVLMLFLYHGNEHERKAIINFFKWRKEQEEEWG